MRKRVLLASLILMSSGCAVTEPPTESPLSGSLELTAAETREILRTREVKPMAEDFARMMYVERKPREAFEKYVAEDLIEHDPDFSDGRDSVFTFVKERGEQIGTEFLPIEQWRVYIDQIIVKGDVAIIRTHAFQRRNDAGRVFINFWRWDGDRIVEHWDVIMDVPADKRNPRTVW